MLLGITVRSAAFTALSLEDRLRKCKMVWEGKKKGGAKREVYNKFNFVGVNDIAYAADDWRVQCADWIMQDHIVVAV